MHASEQFHSDLNEKCTCDSTHLESHRDNMTPLSWSLNLICSLIQMSGLGSNCARLVSQICLQIIFDCMSWPYKYKHLFYAGRIQASLYNPSCTFCLTRLMTWHCVSYWWRYDVMTLWRYDVMTLWRMTLWRITLWRYDVWRMTSPADDVMTSTTHGLSALWWFFSHSEVWHVTNLDKTNNEMKLLNT